jgi:hypothetical protein
MNYDEAYAAYNSIIPDELRQEIFHGSAARYHRATLETSERNLRHRVQEILRALCVWRREAEYPVEITRKMLGVLSRGLGQARDAALTAWALLGNGGDGAAQQNDISRNINPHHQHNHSTE